MAAPGVTHPISLSQLLRQPLKELLRLEISASTSATPRRVGASLAPPMPSETSAA